MLGKRTKTKVLPSQPSLKLIAVSVQCSANCSNAWRRAAKNATDWQKAMLGPSERSRYCRTGESQQELDWRQDRYLAPRVHGSFLRQSTVSGCYGKELVVGLNSCFFGRGLKTFWTVGLTTSVFLHSFSNPCDAHCTWKFHHINGIIHKDFSNKSACNCFAFQKKYDQFGSIIALSDLELS